MIAINRQTEREEILQHINRCNRYIAAVYQLLGGLSEESFSGYEHFYANQKAWLDEAIAINQAGDRWYEEEDEGSND